MTSNLIYNASQAYANNLNDFAWSHIKRFHNLDYGTDVICKRHSIKKDKNVEKQASQLSKCLLQAKEYYDSSKNVSLATKPVLLYYSIMSFALAEVLLKQNGDSSLDRARSENGHHGLDFSLSSLKVRKNASLEEEAEGLSAKVYSNKSGKKVGTFSLWEKTARESPIVGKDVFRNIAGGTNTSYRAILTGDNSPVNYNHRKISFLECLKFAPTLIQYVHTYGIQSNLLRVKVSRETEEGRRSEIKLIIHPDDPEKIRKFKELILLGPAAVNSYQYVDINPGFVLTLEHTSTSTDYGLSLPSGFSLSGDESLFSYDKRRMNEFGIYYSGLYMLGMCARYYPDYWIEIIKNNTSLGLAAEQFIEAAYTRIPILILSELVGNYFIARRY